MSILKGSCQFGWVVVIIGGEVVNLGKNVGAMKKEKDLNFVSQRQYAKKLDTSYTTIQNAIVAGKIVRGWDKVAKKIEVAVADEEFGNDFMQLQLNKPGRKEGKPAAATELKLDAATSYSDARRINEILRAQNAELDLHERKRILLPKAEVDRQLQTAGIEIRKAFERLPASCIDQLLSANGRTEALRIFEDRVTTFLNEICQRIEEALGSDENVIEKA